MDTPVRTSDPEEAVRLTRARNYVQALELFEDHLGPLRQFDPGKPAHRFLSFYGVCLAMVSGQTKKALRFCERAVEECDPSPDLYFNLGLVYLRMQRRDLAMPVFREALKLDPLHPELNATLQRMRRRRRPLFRFLGRRHPLNRVTGQVLSRLRRLLHEDEPIPES